MLVLHGTWKPPETANLDGAFFLWGESSSNPSVRRKTPKPPGVHPFQAAEKDMKKAADSLHSGTGRNARPESVLLLLPSGSRAPLASPDLLRDHNDEESAEEPINLSRWKVDGLCILPEDALLLLGSLSGTRTENDDVAIGTDLMFWSKVSKFAMELLSKQRFAPGLVFSGNGAAFARWQYVLNDENDRTRFSMLARSMPPVCRALVHNRNAQEAFLSDFLNSAIDRFVRSSAPATSGTTAKTPGLPGAWLESLASGEPVRLHAQGIKKLSEGMSSWNAPIREIEKSGFRTCFSLEPPEDAGVWNLRYFLQAADDQSLLVPAETVWRGAKDTLQFLNHKFDHPQEKLLADLGTASRLYSPLENSLHSARPDSAQLTTRQAHAFLRDAVPLFVESGFGVLMPPWWSKGTARFGVKLNVKPKCDAKTGKGMFGFDSIISYDWQLAVGDEPISREEFEHLASLKEPLVRMRGQWVEIKKEDIEAAIKFLKSRNSGEMRLGDAVRLGIVGGETGTALPITGFAASGWLSELFENLSGRVVMNALPQPNGFVGTLRPYQVKGFSWLAFLRRYGLGACLADDMGLGKTIQMLALILRDKEEGADKPTLLICPMSVVGNWQREAHRFAPALRVLVHHGGDRKRKKEFMSDVRKYDVVISTYALAHRDGETLSRVEWNGVVLDEAQNIKNRFTKQSQAVRKFPSNYCVALTGTPVENRLSELWSIMEFLNPGYLGSAEKFREKFALPIERYNDKDAGTKLRNVVSPFVLRRLKTDPAVITDLPEKIEMKVHCNLTKEQATLYEAVVRDMLRKIRESEGIERKGLVLSALVRLKQVCNHPALFSGDGSSLPGRSGKLNRITEMLDEVLSEDAAALVFTQFAEMGHLLKTHFQSAFGQEALFLHGGISQKHRDRMVTRFSEKDGPGVFILSLKAGGVGLNLTRASHVFHFDRWWNPAVENQATDRAFRIGQTKNVQVHKFLCDGTLEERIDEMIERKKALAENIIGTGEGWLTEMTTEKLRDLFTLRREAMADE